MTGNKQKNNHDLAELVKRASKGDDRAFAEIHETYVGAIYRFVLASIGDRDEAEDITQEVFIKAWRSLPTYTEQGRPFSAWLYRVAKNAMIDHARKKKPISLDDVWETEHQESWKDNPSIIFQEKEIAGNVIAAMVCLTEEQREVVLLKFIEGYTNKEIAEITGTSEVGVRQMQCRALKALRNHITNSK